MYKAKGDYDRALTVELKTCGENHPDVGSSYNNNIGSVYKEKSEYDNALEYYTKSLSILINVLGENHHYVASCRNNIAVMYSNKEDYDKAFHQTQHYGRESSCPTTTSVLCTRRKVIMSKLSPFNSTHKVSITDVAISYKNMSSVYRQKGYYDKAVECCTKSLSIQLTTSSENHPYVAFSYDRIGSVWEKRGDYKKALEYYSKSLSIQLKTSMTLIWLTPR